MNDFMARRSELDLDLYVIETFQFETDIDPEEAAIHLCQEQSTAQWKRVDVDEDFRIRYGAKLLNLKTVGEKSYVAEIAQPHINFGTKIPNLLTTVCGEGVFYSPAISTIKLLDLEFPESYLKEFQGPQFGVQGVRDLLNIHNRPIFLGVVKPNIGLDPKGFAELAYQSWLGGLDAPKDDEMLADTAYSPLAERTKLLGALRKKAEQETGEKKMFIANITDEVDRIQELHDIAVQNGVNAVMLNAWTTGLSAARVLRKKAKVPMVSHFDFVAAFSRIPNFGMSERLAIKLQRLAGFDMIIFAGLSPRMKTTEAEMLSHVRACLEPWGNIKPALPVPGGSDWAGTLPSLFEKIGHADFGMVPGRGVFNHPAGPSAGAKSFRQAWEAIQQGITLNEFAKTHVELKQAIEAFGN
ncbi:MAG: RuBisCO large subunit C-terminal-like domain-containing protein [Deltaproteobacteria bacterium]|nr:RuBisCO large subunit C-terminal-like domain-containing protein [Deltaproteobacteria bacterium]